MTDYVTTVMNKHARRILEGDGVCIPDEPEEMNWRLFFAHSQDMQGFRADIFTGGENEADNPHDPAYEGLRDRCRDPWQDSRTMISGLADLWDYPETQKQLKYHSNPFRPKEDKAAGIVPCMALLRGQNANTSTRLFAATLDALHGDKVARKSNRMIRAYVENAAMLRRYDFSFRNYLLCTHRLTLPTTNPAEIENAERTWLGVLERQFFNVGPALANYLICDWLLRFWREGSIPWFSSYKQDSVFIKALAQANKLPSEAVKDFPAYCRSLTMLPAWTPAKYPALIGASVPPRLLNEAIWLEENQSSQRPA